MSKTLTAILIGAGNLGQALLNYNNFARRGFIFQGIFDAENRFRRLVDAPRSGYNKITKQNDRFLGWQRRFLCSNRLPFPFRF